MDQIWKRVLAAAALSPLIGVAAIGGGRRFYPDDPIWRMPEPAAVHNPQKRGINLLYDFTVDSFAPPGQRQTPDRLIPALDVNTVGEVPDSEWYVNRHYWRPMSIEALRRGPARGNEPSPPFTITAGKTEGITPGFQMNDGHGRKYVVKGDPLSNPEMATAADVIGSKFFYALGYYTPENYITYFTRDQLKVSPDAKYRSPGGEERRMTEFDLTATLAKMPRDSNGRYRVMASLYIEGKGVGETPWYGTRKDDPNDIFPHEHRRTARGLYTMCTWLNHTDIKAEQTYETVVETGGVPYIRHYLLDFGSMLGSDSDAPKDARLGHRYMLNPHPSALAKMFSAGLWVEDWERADYGGKRAVGRFTAEAFDPDRWTPNYPNPAFLNRLPDDDFWGAKQVMAFTNDQIRAIVETGQYSKPSDVDYIVGVLEERRDLVGRTFFAKVLPLDRFEIRSGELIFHNLAVDYGFAQAPRYQWEWAGYDNERGTRGPAIEGATGSRVPPASRGAYLMATIRAAGDDAKQVRVYLRDDKVVGIDRTW